MGPVRELLPFLLVVAGLAFVGLPLIMWRLLGEDATPRYEPFDPSRHATPPEVGAFIRDNVAALAADGFTQAGDLVRDRGANITRVTLLEHPEGETATVAVVYSERGTAAPLVEFTVVLTDGRVFDVNNSVSVPVFAPHPGHEVKRFPEVRDPVRLHRLFRTLLRRRFGSPVLVRRDIARDPARFLAGISDTEYRAQVAAGYFRFDERARRFRPTLKGAYLMTWKMLPPFATLRKRRLRREARELLREIGMEGVDQRPVAAVTAVTPVTPLEELLPGVIAAPRDTPRRWAVRIGGFALLLAMTASVVYQRVQARRAVRLPGLVVPADFPGAIRALEQVTAHAATPLVGRDSVGAERESGAYVVTVQSRWANRFLQAAHEKFAARGFFLSRFDRNFRNDSSSVRLLLAPTADPYDVLLLVGTRGESDGRGTADIAEWLRTFARERPFELRNVGADWVRGVFASDVTDPDDVVRRVEAFCPRIAREDFQGNVAALATWVRRSRAFICRWQ